MANLSQIAGQYSFYLVGADSYAASKWWTMLVGVIWIAVMTGICYVGIEASAKTQWFLLGAEIIILAIFAVVALGKVYFGNPVGAIHPSLSWINPFDISSTSALADGRHPRGLHLLGLGLDRDGQRGDRQRDARRPARRRSGAP